MSCLWPMPEGEDAIPPDWETLPAWTKARARTLASRSMERLTGYRVGTCPVTIRPQNPGHLSWCEQYTLTWMDSAPSLVPFRSDGSWEMVSGCTCAPASTVCEVLLPRPVGRVDEVKVDGAVVPIGNYRLDDGNKLTWTGTDECPWPRDQDTGLADTEPGTMSVTYVNAHLPGDEGLAVMAILAVEFGLALIDSDNCRLPTNAQSVTRQGVSITLIPGTFPDGRTGINEIDAYLGIWNPAGLTNPPQVWSPDLAQSRRIGG